MKDGKSSENLKYGAFNQVYDCHLAELKKIQGDNPQCYHLILNSIRKQDIDLFTYPAYFVLFPAI